MVSNENPSEELNFGIFLQIRPSNLFLELPLKKSWIVHLKDFDLVSRRQDNIFFNQVTVIPASQITN